MGIYIHQYKKSSFDLKHYKNQDDKITINSLSETDQIKDIAC